MEEKILREIEESTNKKKYVHVTYFDTIIGKPTTSCLTEEEFYRFFTRHNLKIQTPIRTASGEFCYLYYNAEIGLVYCKEMEG